MVTSILLGLVCIFFVLGHSTLLFFRAAELPVMPINDLIFPWPQRGRVVSFICFGLCLIFLLIAIQLPIDINIKAASTWKILISTAIGPISIYMSYILNRIRNNEEKMVFVSAASTRKDWALPIALGALISVAFWIH